MAKKHAQKAHHHHKTVKTARVVKAKPAQDGLVMVQGWMFVVAFALMLGVGAIVGTFVNQALSEPTVAGVSVTR